MPSKQDDAKPAAEKAVKKKATKTATSAAKKTTTKSATKKTATKSAAKATKTATKKKAPTAAAASDKAAPAKAAKASAAKKPAKPSTPVKLRVRQVRSTIRRQKTFQATLEALGIHHHQAEVVVTDSPSTRGMLKKLRHLIRVTPEE